MFIIVVDMVDRNPLEPPKDMVFNKSFSHLYAILLRFYYIEFSQTVILIVNNFLESLLNTWKVSNPP